MILSTVYFCLLTTFLLLISDYTSVGQSSQEVFKQDIKIGGQIRYRGELDLRFFDFNAKPLFYNLLRTRLNAEVSISPSIKTFIQFQDSRNFGEENSRFWRGTLDGSSDNFDLHQGWIEFKDLAVDNLSFKLGRMMFATNSERIIGPLEWHNYGRSFDGGVVTYKFDEWQLRGFVFQLGSGELMMTSATPQTPKMLSGIDINIPYIPNGNLYAYYDLNEKTTSSFAPGLPTSLPKLSRYTIGAFTKNDKQGIVWELETALQLGSIDTLPRQQTNSKNDINAWLVSAYCGYKEANYTIGGGVDIYTGDDPNTDEYEGFDHLFFTLHKFYGAMDFLPITVLPGAGIRPGIEGTTKGLIMPNIKASWNPDNKWKFDVGFMLMQTFEPYKFGGDDLTNLGTEIDLLATYAITKGVNAQFGSSIFLPGEILEKTNISKGMGIDPSFWGYTMITIDF